MPRMKGRRPEASSTKVPDAAGARRGVSEPIAASLTDDPQPSEASRDPCRSSPALAEMLHNSHSGLSFSG